MLKLNLGLEALMIESTTIVADRKFLLDLVIALGELHGRVCTDISDCGDMDRATVLGAELGMIQTISDHVNILADEANDL